MPGSPKKRRQQEREAIRRAELTVKEQADEAARSLPQRRIRYTPALGEEICRLLAAGVPVEDSTLRGAILSAGIASRIGIHPSTFYDWQQQHEAFAEGIARARQESAHRIADRILALADVALSEPSMANAVRVAGDLLKWQAAVRHPQIYGERQRLEVNHTVDMAARLMEARQRVIEHDSTRHESDEATVPEPLKKKGVLDTA